MARCGRLHSNAKLCKAVQVKRLAEAVHVQPAPPWVGGGLPRQVRLLVEMSCDDLDQVKEPKVIGCRSLHLHRRLDCG